MRLLLKRREQRAEEESRRQRELSVLLAISPPRLVQDVAPYLLEVQRSRLPEETGAKPGESIAPYVPRDFDRSLRDQLMHRKPFVLLVGRPGAGKSRSAFEAALALLGDHLMIVPRPVAIGADTLTTIFQLLGQGSFGKAPALLWLEDLDRYLEIGALNPELVNRWRQRREVLILATMRTSAYERLWLSGVARPGEVDVLGEGRAVLDQATVIQIPAQLSRAEVDSAKRLYPGLIGSDVSLGEQLIVGPLLVEKFESATQAQAALISAIVDWERTGMNHPVDAAELEELWVIYAGQGHTDSITRSEFEPALQWATAPLGPHTALVHALPDGYKADDYVAALLARSAERHPPPGVPDGTWEWVIGRASADDALAVGISAYAQGDIVKSCGLAGEVAWRSPVPALDCDPVGDGRASVKEYDQAVITATATAGPRAGSARRNRRR